MKINQHYLSKLQEFGLEEAKGIVFGFLITFRQHKGIEDFILDDHEGKRALFPYDEFQKYSINLCRMNVDTGINELVVPLFQEVSNEEFLQFVSALESFGLTNTGHLNNPTEFNIFSSSTEDLDAFDRTLKTIKDCNISKLAEVTAKFYETAKFPSKLKNFLGTTNVITAYNGY